jgi:hypothetical protein
MEKTKKPFYKKWWIWLIAIIIIGAVASSGEDSTSKDTKGSNEVAKKADAKTEEPVVEEKKEYGLNQEVTVKEFVYNITKVEETTVLESDNMFIDDVTTSGEFLIVTASITNNDKKARMLDTSLVQLKDNQDREFEPLSSGDAIMWLGDNLLFLEEVNPGLSRTGKFIFEVPTDVTSYSLEVGSGVGFAGGSFETIKLK